MTKLFAVQLPLNMIEELRTMKVNTRLLMPVMMEEILTLGIKAFKEKYEYEELHKK